MVDLLGHLSNGIVVLLAEGGKSSLMLNVGLLKIAAEFSELSFTLLVELNLGRGGTTSLIKALAEFLELLAEVGLALLSLGASLALVLEFFLKLLNTGLELLDLLLELGDKALFILELGSKRRNFLVLALDGALKLLLIALKIGNSLLSKLEVALNLPLGLLNLSAELLLALKRVLKLVKGLLKLYLDLVEVVALVLNSLKILSGLLVAFLQVLLLLVDLVDKFVLVGDLVIEAADLVVLGGLVLVGLLDVEFHVLNILLEGSHFLVGLLLALEELVAGILLTLQSVGELLQEENPNFFHFKGTLPSLSLNLNHRSISLQHEHIKQLSLKIQIIK